MVSSTSPSTRLQWLSYACGRKSCQRENLDAEPEGVNRRTYMESAFELTIAPELYKHNLVEQKAHQVQRLGHGGSFVSHVSHCEKRCGGKFEKV